MSDQPLTDIELGFATLIGSAVGEDVRDIRKRVAGIRSMTNWPKMTPATIESCVKLYLDMVRRSLDEIQAGTL